MRQQCKCETHFPDGTHSKIECKDVKKQFLHVGRKLYIQEGKEMKMDGKVSFMAEKIKVCHEIQRKMIEQGIDYMDFRNVKLIK